MINYKFLSLSLKIKNNIVKASNINPLKLKELDVPVINANAPNGILLKGINPKLIIETLITRPRLSGSELDWSRVVFNDINTELNIPIKITRGIAM